MLTLFSSPKPFIGHTNIIQRNAINSWKQLKPICQIILFGDEEGTADVAEEFGIRHVPEVAKNEFGTPIVSDLFEKAQQLSDHELMCYINSDILLFNEVIHAVNRVLEYTNNFLIVGRCWNLNISKPLDFSQPNWHGNVNKILEQHGEDRGPWGIDYFIFRRWFYSRMPPFAIGRAYFDNWLIWKAIAQKTKVVDISRCATVIHQNHDYSHIDGGQNSAYRGDEAIHNTNLGGGISHRYCILDATHYLDPSGLKRNFMKKLSWTMLKIWAKRIWYLLIDLSRPVRHPIGLRSDLFQKLSFLLTRKKMIHRDP